ncbi:hypothetical protein Q8F55_003156 [Vanrija albida]|uniref:Uncharacterized protein n=1 Tax=Vanrija albida TaxID=181172 RepID=A0ABR3QBQ1_9TREE
MSLQLKIYALFYALQIKAGLLNLFFYTAYHNNLTLFAALLIVDGLLIDYGMSCAESWILEARQEVDGDAGSDATSPSPLAPPEKAAV